MKGANFGRRGGGKADKQIKAFIIRRDQTNHKTISWLFQSSGVNNGASITFQIMLVDSATRRSNSIVTILPLYDKLVKTFVTNKEKASAWIDSVVNLPVIKTSLEEHSDMTSTLKHMKR